VWYIISFLQDFVTVPAVWSFIFIPTGFWNCSRSVVFHFIPTGFCNCSRSVVFHFIPTGFCNRSRSVIFHFILYKTDINKICNALFVIFHQ
jgi:hypothetical protein